MRVFHSSRREHEAPWLSFTDLLSNSLILLTLVVVFSTIARVMNEKPPVIQLPDNEKFRFGSGSYQLSPEFLAALQADKIPQITRTLNCFGVDTIEIIGHTDGQPNSGYSNLDSALLHANEKLNLSRAMTPGSNVDLGLLRAIAVKEAIQARLDSDADHIIFRVYSAGSVISPEGEIKKVANRDDKARRRIEIRFTRTRDTTLPKNCPA